MRPADPIKRVIQQAGCEATDTTRRRIWQDVAAKLDLARTAGSAQGGFCLGRVFMTNKLAVPSVLVVGIIIGVMIGAALPRSQAVSGPQADLPSQTNASASPQPDIFSMRKMAAARDVKGLATVLSDGHFENRLVAANFLAKMAPLPALETVSMHAVGDLRVDRQGDRLRLFSTGNADWLELAGGMLIVHTGSTQEQATLVRLTHDREGDERQWQDRQREWANLRTERADLEKRLAGVTGFPGDVNELRQRLDKYNEILDLADRAIYIRPAQGGLLLQDQVYHREAYLFPSDSGVRAEWHGDTLDADSITLLHGLAPVRTEGPAVPPAGWRARFESVYSLVDGEILRWVRPPFIPERRNYTQELHYYSGADNPPPPLFMSFRWDGALRRWALAMHECGLASVLTELGLRRYEMDGPKGLLQLRLGGDWIVRTEIPVEQGLRELESILERELGRRIRFLPQTVKREVIVVRGRFDRRYLESHEDKDTIYLFAGDAPGGSMSAGGRGSIAEMLDVLGNRFNRPIVSEAEGLDGHTSYQAFLPAFYVRKLGSKESVPVPGDEEKLDSALVNLTRQTSLEFSREVRPFAMWLVTEMEEPNDVNAPAPPSR